jgi:cysteine-rich repeat protein
MMTLTNRTFRIAGALALAAALVFACSSTPTGPNKTDCKAGTAYFCRCADRQEGTRVCNDDGFTYGPCEPCFPTEPPPPEEDGSFPTEDVFVPASDAGDSGDGGDAGPCPNGTVEPGEECDDGNRTANDGCSTTCTLQAGTTTGDKCPGMAVHVWDKPVVFVGRTVGALDDYSANPDCAGASGFGSPERVFAVTAHKAGTMRVATSAADFPHMIYRANACAPVARDFTYAACSNVAANGNETLMFPVTAGTTYFVVVDGGAAGQQQGNFTVTFSIP